MRHLAIILVTCSALGASAAIAADKSSANDVAAKSHKLNFSKQVPSFLWGWLVELYNRHYVEAYSENMKWGNPPFSIAFFDVDKDKTQKHNASEVFVKWEASIYCGASGGCATDILRFDGKEYQNIGNLSGGDVEIDKRMFNGMPVIWAAGYRYRWNGSRYIYE
jgi:hypothetical protein